MSDELRERIMRTITRTAAFGGVVPSNARDLADEIVAAIQPYIAAKRAVDYSDYAVHHIDGNPHNHAPGNLRLVKIRDRS